MVLPSCWSGPIAATKFYKRLDGPSLRTLSDPYIYPSSLSLSLTFLLFVHKNFKLKKLQQLRVSFASDSDKKKERVGVLARGEAIIIVGTVRRSPTQGGTGRLLGGALGEGCQQYFFFFFFFCFFFFTPPLPFLDPPPFTDVKKIVFFIKKNTTLSPA